MTYRIEITAGAKRTAANVVAKSAWHAIELVLRQHPTVFVTVRGVL